MTWKEGENSQGLQATVGCDLPNPMPTNYLTNPQTNSTEQMPTREANNCSATQQTPRIIRNPTATGWKPNCR
jgi:hypothetical protein